MESPNDQKLLESEPVEKSAFADDIEMIEGSNGSENLKKLQQFTATRTFESESQQVNEATFLHPKVQLTLVNLYVKCFDLYTSVGNRDERTPTDKWIRAAVNLLRKEV